MLERLEQRPLEQEPLAEEVVSGRPRPPAVGEREELARVVPVVQRVVQVHSLVTLQPNSRRPGRAASALATSVLPTPASPSSSSG